MNDTLKSLRAELKLNGTQMKATGADAETLKNRQQILKQELAASREKTVLLNNKLQEAVKIFGSNSKEAKNLAMAVMNAKNVEAAIQGELKKTNEELEKQKRANSELAQSVEKADTKIAELDRELNLNSTMMQSAGDKTNLLKDRQKLLAEQANTAKDKMKALEQALDTCGREVGDNSDEYARLKANLIEAKTEQAAIQGEIKKTTQELKDQKTQLQIVGDQLGKFGDGAERAGQATRVLSAGAAAGLTGAGAAVIQFESAFAGVTKTVDEVYDANGKCTYSYQELEDGIRNMAKEIPASVTEISSVAEAAGQLGIKTEDVLGFTRVMIDMGESTNLSSDVAAESIAKFANITGLAADQTMAAEEKYSRLGSTVVALGNNYATTEADIVAMAQNLASAGTQVGMSESDILALATSLSSVGMEAQAGGTAFSKAMIEMQLAVETNSDSLKDWASVAGMSTEEFATAFREDATGALQAFIEGLSKCGGESESAIKILDDMGIKETRMRDALLRSANASDIFTSAIKLGEDAWNENNALTEEASKRYETTASQISIMKNNLVDAGISLGSVFLPIINDGVKKVTEFADKLSGMGEGSLKAIAGTLAIVAVMSTALAGIGKVSNGISALIGFGSKLAGAFSGVGTAATAAGGTAAAGMSLPLIPILAVVAGIAAVIGIFALLWNKSESFRDFFTGIWEGFDETISGFLKKIDFGDKIDAIKEKFSGLKDKLSGLENVFKIIGTVASIILVPAIGVLAGIFNAFLSAIEPAIQILGGIIDALSGLGDLIVGVFTGDTKLADEGARLFVQGIGEIFGGLWGSVSGILSGFVDGLVGFFASLADVCGVDAAISKIDEMIQTGFELAKTYIINPISQAYQTVSNTFSNIYTAISNKINLARDTVKSAINQIKGFFNFSWSLPKLKLPHFSITGSFSLNPPSVPKFGVDWYAKGAIFTKPTILDSYAGWKGVGEAGPEAVLPIHNLRNYVEESMENIIDRRMGGNKTSQITHISDEDMRRIERIIERRPVMGVFKIGEREMSKTLAEPINDITNAKGTLLKMINGVR